jgi:hypothetical protein
LGAAMKLLNNMMVNYSKWHTDQAGNLAHGSARPWAPDPNG